LLSPPLFGKHGGKTVEVAYIKNALAKSQLIFIPKSRRFGWFQYSDDAVIHTASQSRTSNGGEGIKTFHHLPYLPDIAQQSRFCQRVKTELSDIFLSQLSIKRDVMGSSEP
jgi:hypothetical protein